MSVSQYIKTAVSELIRFCHLLVIAITIYCSDNGTITIVTVIVNEYS